MTKIEEKENRRLKEEVKILKDSLKKLRQFKKTYTQKVNILNSKLDKSNEEQKQAILSRNEIELRLNNANKYLKQSTIILFSKKQF